MSEQSRSMTWSHQQQHRVFTINHQYSLPLQANELLQFNIFNKEKILEWIQKKFRIKNVTVKIECLRASEKTQVYKVLIDKSLKYIIKFFCLECNFLNELFALTLFENESITPKVIDSCEKSLFLVMEYIPYKFNNYKFIVDKISFYLGKLHSYEISHRNLLIKLFPEKTTKSVLKKNAELTWVKDKNSFHEALLLSSKYHGEKHISMMIGDIKPEHILLRKNRECVFVDLETFAIGLPSYFDVLSLSNFNPIGHRLNENQWMKILEKYLEGKFQKKATEKEIQLNYQIMKLFALSIGYKEMFYSI